MGTQLPWFLRPAKQPGDCNRLVRILTDCGYTVSLSEAEAFWRRHSKRCGEVWRKLPQADGGVKSVISTEVDALRKEWYKANPPQ